MARPTRKNAPPPAINGRLPPQNLDAEKYVLSACMLQREAVDVVGAVLTPACFYASSHGQIFEAIQEVAAANQPVDVGTVGAHLRRVGHLTQVGGPSYLAEICDAVPYIAHVEAYAQEVHDLWRMRELIATCQRISAEGYGPIADVKAFIAKAEQDVFAIANDTRAATSGPRSISMAMRAATQRLIAMHESGSSLRGVTYGYPDLDRLTSGLKPGELVVVGARPSVGKSAFAMNVAVNTAKAGHGVLVFSIEMPEEDMGERVLAMEARESLAKFANNLTTNYGPLTDAAERSHRLDLWLDCRSDLAIQDVRAVLRRLIAQRSGTGHQPIKVVVIDYLQLMRGDPDAETDAIRIGINSRGLKVLAKEFGVAVVVLSQLNRDIETRPGKDKRPLLADLKGSGSIEQDADTVIFLHRDDYQSAKEPGYATPKSGPAEAIIRKQRGGALGTVHFVYFAEQTRFEAAAPGYHTAPPAMDHYAS